MVFSLEGSFPDWGLVSLRPPKDLREALVLIKLLISACSAEVAREQVLPFFNILLAPFVSGVDGYELKEELRRFLMELSGLAAAGRDHLITIGLELSNPEFMARSFPDGEGEVFLELSEEAGEVAFALLSAISELGCPSPSLGLVIHVDPRAVGPDDPLLLKAHEVASTIGLPVFALRSSPSVVSFDGSTHLADWTGDWELDLLRSGRAGRIVLNLPRIAYEAGGDLEGFLRGLGKVLAMAIKASLQRKNCLKERAERKLMPALMADVGGDSYLRISSVSYPLGFVGLPEACLALSGELPHEGSGGLEVAERILEVLSRELEAYWAKLDIRCPLSSLSARGVPARLAELDVERYGWARVRILGPRDKPVYTAGLLPPDTGLSLEERIELEARLHKRIPGGSLLFLAPDELDLDPPGLAGITLKALGRGVRAISYPSDLTYCSACGRAFRGSYPKCPACGRVSTITGFTRSPEGYIRDPSWGRYP